MRHRSRRTAYLAALLLLAASAPAYAAPSITASATAGATSLPLDGEGSSTTRIVKVATIEMSTTLIGGFTATFTSGSLTRADGSGTPISFQVALVNQGASPPTASAFTVPSGSTLTFSAIISITIVRRDLYIMYRSASLQDPGAYSASIDAAIR
jgi:hypothetical protein